MIPQGKYNAKGVEGSIVQSKTGTPGVSVIVEIVDGEHAGSRMRWDGWLTDGQMGQSTVAQRTVESLRYLGWSTDDLDNLEGITTNVVQIVVGHEERDVNGEMKTFARVNWINKLGGGAKISDEARVHGAAAKAISQRFRAIARGVAKVAANSPRPQTPPARRATTSAPAHAPDAPDFGDDDIPF